MGFTSTMSEIPLSRVITEVNFKLLIQAENSIYDYHNKIIKDCNEMIKLKVKLLFLQLSDIIEINNPII